MAQITLQGNAIETIGTLPAKGAAAPAFTLVKTDLSEATLADYKGKKVVLNIFPSIDTSVCAASVRQRSTRRPPARTRTPWCSASPRTWARCSRPAASARPRAWKNVETLSVFRLPAFGKDYGVTVTTGLVGRPALPRHSGHRPGRQGGPHRAGAGDRPGAGLRRRPRRPRASRLHGPPGTLGRSGPFPSFLSRPRPLAAPWRSCPSVLFPADHDRVGRTRRHHGRHLLFDGHRHVEPGRAPVRAGPGPGHRQPCALRPSGSWARRRSRGQCATKSTASGNSRQSTVPRRTAAAAGGPGRATGC